MRTATDTEISFVPPWGVDMPMLPFFYGGEMTRQRVNKEADRLVAFANHQALKHGVSPEGFQLWRDGLEVWRQHWYAECTG